MFKTEDQNKLSFCLTKNYNIFYLFHFWSLKELKVKWAIRQNPPPQSKQTGWTQAEKSAEEPFFMSRKRLIMLYSRRQGKAEPKDT